MQTPNIITSETREIVAALDESVASNGDNSDSLTRQLITHLSVRCGDPEIQEKYFLAQYAGSGISEYPLDSRGYAQAFDVLEDESALFDHWSRLGIVVGRSVVAESLCNYATTRIKSSVMELSDGSCDLDDPSTHMNLPIDSSGVPILSRGFLEIYHDDSFAQLRQSLKAYLHHVVLWGRPDLWTTYDRFGVKLPGHQESAALPLHVDQNPKEHPNFKTVQGVLALVDCPVDRGTLVAVPGSRALFADYLPMAPDHGEYVELDTDTELHDRLGEAAQALALRRGDLVSWDSRTTHANTANISDRARFVALMAAGIAVPEDYQAVIARQEAFETGVGSNVRSALMHASKKPRYSNPAALAQVRRAEDLTPLGRRLYGTVDYGAL